MGKKREKGKEKRKGKREKDCYAGDRHGIKGTSIEKSKLLAHPEPVWATV